MWVNRQFFDMVIADNKKMQDQITALNAATVGLRQQNSDCCAQKAKDDITIDWLRHRVNALEKEKASLLVAKGIPVSVPEIVPTRPGTITAPPANFEYMPSFEDVGDEEARRLGVTHDEDGHIQFTMPEGK